MKISRRLVLKGLGGVALGLPFLESFGVSEAKAADEVQPFAIFLRQANGVATALKSEVGDEPERFWPKSVGALSADNVSGRAIDELGPYLDRLLVVRGVNMKDYNFGDGHARGALQGLTARGPTVAGAAGDSEADGESIDHRIGRELNPGGRDSLFLYAGKSGGWLGGPCISYRGSGTRRSALHNPWAAYQTIIGGDASISPEARAKVVGRQKSVNDLVRGQLQSLMARPELSTSDKQRLQLHFDSVRDLEIALTCRMAADQELLLEGKSAGYDSSDGDVVIATTKLHMDVAALAIACGYTRSVAIQVGSGNDGSTRYPNPDTGALMADNYHYISHRRKSHDSSGSVIAGSDLLHSHVDRHFARMFKYLLDKLSAYVMPSGKQLLQHGVAVWHNDNSSGPPHGAKNVPFVLAGSANGFLKQGLSLELTDKSEVNIARMLGTLGSAAGLKQSDGSPIDDFGDPSLPRGVLTELLA
ncbi:MAG: DUF1552 domain-containing protein [Myxococcales bacterium]|nr:DUF1552 domain-containing protein [Myxococcales bacterium]